MSASLVEADRPCGGFSTHRGTSMKELVKAPTHTLFVGRTLYVRVFDGARLLVHRDDCYGTFPGGSGPA